MTLNSLLCADVLRPLDLVPLTDFTCKYHPAPATYFSPFLDLRPVRTLVKSKHNPVCSRHATNSHPEQRTPCTTAAGRGGGSHSSVLPSRRCLSSARRHLRRPADAAPHTAATCTWSVAATACRSDRPASADYTASASLPTIAII